VICAGTMRYGLAHTLAQLGFTVKLIDISDPSIERGMKTIANNLDRIEAKGTINEEDKHKPISNINTYIDMKVELEGVDLVVEAATENINLKLKIFQQLEELTDSNVILATNTSSISITQIAAVTKRADKVIGMHFMNPVPIMKLVEIIKGYSTSKETFDTIY